MSCYRRSRNSQTGGSQFNRNPFSMGDGGPARFYCAIRRARHLRHNAPTADHALDLTSGPQVCPNEYPEFVLLGRGGHLYG
jgi:hypothetical protein